MQTETMVFGAEVRRSEMWRVYRIRTANSTYELEVQTEVSPGVRRCAVMTCVEPVQRAGQTFEDSSPLIGNESLYGVNPLDWIGRVVRLGTAATSEIQSVDFIRSGATRTTRAPVAAAPQQEPSRSWAPYPQGQVEMLEAAASVLKAVCHQHQLKRDLSHDRRLQRRYELAIAECELMLETLSER